MFQSSRSLPVPLYTQIPLSYSLLEYSSFSACITLQTTLALSAVSLLFFISFFYSLKRKNDWTWGTLESCYQRQSPAQGDKSSIFFYVYRLLRQFIISQENECAQPAFKIRRSSFDEVNKNGIQRSQVRVRIKGERLCNVRSCDLPRTVSI